MKTIVVPTDLSPETHIALSVATDIARLYKATIVLLHNVVYPMPMVAFPEAAALSVAMTGDDYQEAEDEAQKTIEQFVTDPRYAGVNIEPALITNGQGLIHNIASQPADLIVMASRGAAGLEELFVGSNAEVIVRYATCPVLIVKQPIDHFRPENIICAVDVDDRLKTIRRFPFQMGERGLNQFLYVLTPTDSREPEGIRDWVNSYASAKGITEFTFTIRHAPTIPQGINGYADEVNADLIVLFTNGRKGLEHVLTGSVAEDVVNHASAPVLVMRA